MADSRQYWMDEVIRQVAEDNMNPDDRSLGMARALTAEEEAMSQAVLAEREEPYMGNLGRAIGAIRDFAFPSGPQVPLAGIRGVTPTVGAGDLPNVAKDMALPLLASDLGVTGAMANVPIPFPGMGKKPVQAGAKKFVPRKKPYKSKTDPIAEATSRISDDYQFLDSTSKGKVARAGLSKERYQQLLDDGYDFDRIMKEHPRLSPEEWVDIEDVAGRPETFKTSTTPKEIPSNLSNDPKLERWPDQIPKKGKGSLQDQPDFPINHPAKTEFGKHWGNMADESGYTDLIANHNPTNSPLHTPEKAKEAFYQMLDMDPHKRFVNHDSKSNYDIHTIFREIENFAMHQDPSIINFNRYKRDPFFWQWGRN